jgi:hypothetical protein
MRHLDIRLRHFFVLCSVMKTVILWDVDAYRSVDRPHFDTGGTDGTE